MEDVHGFYENEKATLYIVYDFKLNWRIRDGEGNWEELSRYEI